MRTSDFDSRLLQERHQCPRKSIPAKGNNNSSSAHMAVCASKIQPALVWIKVRQINRLIFKCCSNSQGQCKVQLITPVVAGTSAPWVFDFPGRCWTPAAVTRHFVRFVSKRFLSLLRLCDLNPQTSAESLFSTISHSIGAFLYTNIYIHIHLC